MGAYNSEEVKNMDNVLLVFGGEAAEREVSIVTGMQIAAFCPEKYKLFAVILDEDGRMFWVKKHDAALCARKERNKKYFVEVCVRKRALWACGGRKMKKICDTDKAIIACHGGKGENGELVAALEFEGLGCSVGSPLALGIAMDKVVAKAAFKFFGVPVVDSFWFDKDKFDNMREQVKEQALAFGYPLVVKPARQGSSVGIGFVRNPEEFEDAVELALEFDDKILVEKGLVGFRELNVSTINAFDKVVVSEVEEPFRHSQILSFEDKYLGGGKGKLGGGKGGKLGGAKLDLGKDGAGNGGAKTGSMVGVCRQFPADVDVEISDRIKEIAEDVVCKLGLIGVARLDFMLVGDDLFLNEINSVPGSLAFYFWTRKGEESEFFEKLVVICDFERKNKKHTPIATFLK